jgi:excisionase family DNA binding protein
MLSPASPHPRVSNPDPALRYAEAAQYINVSVKTIRRLVKAKRLKAVQLTDQIPGIRVSELERHLSRDAA